MPKQLRELYKDGAWKDHDVYMWPTVLKISKEGHELAENAEQALHYPSYKLKPVPDGKVITETSIAEALAATNSNSEKIKQVIIARANEKERRNKELSREYRKKRQLWVKQLEKRENEKTPEEKGAEKARDRQLMLAIRNTNMSTAQIDQAFEEFESAGGTAGGMDRWSRCITSVPPQDPNYLPPASDGGGVLIENPLADHYAARSINPWTQAERLLFLEKFVVHSKNFRKIASFFEHKSVEDCVRFYFDNKMRLGLKNLARDTHFRKRGNRKLALVELSRLPEESRSIKDNFLHQPGFMSPERDNQPENYEVHADTRFSTTSFGKGWSMEDRQALVFALCRYDVTEDEEHSPVPTVWASIAAAVGTKTPRQCRQFYFQHKQVLGLNSYFPSKPSKALRKRRKNDKEENSDDSGPKKSLKRSNSVAGSSSGPAVGATVVEMCPNYNI